jgi:hypothetical protein
MTLNDFIVKLQDIREDLRDKEIKILAMNGLLFSPEVNYKLLDQNKPLDKSAKNVEMIVLTY